MARQGEQVAVYASHEELARWRAAAAKAGTSLSTWIRERCEKSMGVVASEMIQRGNLQLNKPLAKELTYEREREE